ncbi:MAG: hypothetical protein WKF75_18750 [Singulisphaera sp.]
MPTAPVRRRSPKIGANRSIAALTRRVDSSLPAARTLTRPASRTLLARASSRAARPGRHCPGGR